MRFVFEKQELDYEEKMNKVSFEFDSFHLEEVLEEFNRFLVGCGFTLDGKVGIVSDYDNYSDWTHQEEISMNQAGGMPSYSIDLDNIEIKLDDNNDDLLHIRV